MPAAPGFGPQQGPGFAPQPPPPVPPGMGRPGGAPVGPGYAPDPGRQQPAVPPPSGPPPGPPGVGFAGPQPGGGSLADRYTPDGLRRAAQVACPILVLIGLSWPEGGETGWSRYLLWAVFAAVAAIGQLSSITKSATSSPSQAWTVAALCTGALLVYWVLIVLPEITSNGGFLQTLGVGAAATSLWLTPRRV